LSVLLNYKRFRLSFLYKYHSDTYKSYSNVVIGPLVTNIPLQQPVNQPPATQQPIALPAPIAAAPAQPQIIPPAPVAAAAAAPLPILLIVVNLH
jgi:hypothetical protein